jgi:Escherichia/Staphylococcus phage prohead protease
MNRKERRRSLPLTPEIREFRTDGVEIRHLGKTDEAEIRGQPIVYDSAYEVSDYMGTFRESVRPGAVSGVLARNADVRLLVGHDQSSIPLARTASGTLTLRDTPTALTFVARLDMRSQQSNDLVVAIERGDISGLSIGFLCGRDTWSGDGEVRTIHEIRQLLEISCVAFPCSQSTSLEIAQRMRLSVPVQSRARLRLAVADAIAGKRLSPSQADALKLLLVDGDDLPVSSSATRTLPRSSPTLTQLRVRAALQKQRAA